MEDETSKEISEYKIDDGKFHFLIYNGCTKNEWVPEDKIESGIVNNFIEQKRGIIESNTNIPFEKNSGTPSEPPKYRKANLDTDTVKRIYTISKYHEKDCIILANVEWNVDQQGFTPIACPVTNDYLKAKAPEIYLDFLRSLQKLNQAKK
jgi:hypothetical protein